MAVTSPMTRLPTLNSSGVRTAHRTVTDRLREAILSGELPGGTRLVQSELAASSDCTRRVPPGSSPDRIASRRRSVTVRCAVRTPFEFNVGRRVIGAVTAIGSSSLSDARWVSLPARTVPHAHSAPPGEECGVRG